MDAETDKKAKGTDPHFLTQQRRQQRGPFVLFFFFSFFSVFLGFLDDDAMQCKSPKAHTHTMTQSQGRKLMEEMDFLFNNSKYQKGWCT